MKVKFCKTLIDSRILKEKRRNYNLRLENIYALYGREHKSDVSLLLKKQSLIKTVTLHLLKINAKKKIKPMHLGFKREKQREISIVAKTCLYPENGVSRQVVRCYL